MAIIPWDVQLRAELSAKQWTTMCIQCNTLGSPFVDTVWEFLLGAFKGSVVTIMYPTECCLNIDCALHHEKPVIIAIDLCCPLAHMCKECPVVHVSSRKMVEVESIRLKPVADGSGTSNIKWELDLDRPSLPPGTLLLFEKHYLMRARALGIPRSQRLCVNGDNWLAPILDNTVANSTDSIAIYWGPLPTDLLGSAVSWSARSMSDADQEEDQDQQQNPELVREFLSNAESFALPGYLRLLLSILATSSDSSITTLKLIHSVTDEVHTVDLARVRKLVSATMARDTGLLKGRLKYCVSPLELSAVGLIVGDAHPETLVCARELKHLLRSRLLAAQICYFGPKLDEAKLGNFAHQFTAFVFLAKCPVLMFPWLNPNFRRVSSHYVPCISLYELRYSLGEPEDFCYDYESNLQRCMERIRSLCAD